MVAFGRGKENLDFLKKNDYEAYGCTLLTSELDVNYEKGGNVYRSAMQKQPNVLSGEYDADRNTMYGMAPVILEYYLGNETDVEALDFHPLTAEASDSLRYYYTVPFTGGMYFYNYNTGDYDLMKPEKDHYTREELEEYLSPGNTITVLKIENLHKIYGKYHALSGLDMTVKEGALYGFVGPNGAGKTTAIKIMTGLLQAEEGSVLINGKDALADPDQLKSCIGYVPDFFGVYDNLTVGEYMSFFASCYQLDGLVARKRYTALLEQVGLEDKLDFYVDGLSRGMKQRLCLARALIHDPQILILDEPTSGLDPRTRVEFKEILEDLKFAGKTILISSHVLSELSEMCTDIGIIDQGRMILEGNIQDILSRVNASNPLVISVYSNMEKALSILKSHPCVRTISMREKDICVRFTGDAQDEAILLQQLIDSDVLVNGFTREKGSLETVFMQLTDHEEERVVTSYEAESGL